MEGRMEGKRGKGRPIDKSSWTWRTDTGNSRKRHNNEKSGVVGHLDLPGSRSPKEEKETCAVMTCAVRIDAVCARGFDGRDFVRAVLTG